MEKKSRKKTCPGFMIYFEQLRTPVERMNDAQLAWLLRAMYRYARDGTEPAEKDMPAEAVFFWPLIRDTIFTGKEQYYERCRSNSFASYCRRNGIAATEEEREAFNRIYDMERDSGSDG